MTKLTPLQKKSLKSLAIIATLALVLGLSISYGYVGNPAVNPSFVMSSVKNSRYDIIRENANRIVVDYPAMQTLSKRVTYVMPKGFDALFFMYDKQQIAQFAQRALQMEVSIARADGTRQSTGSKSIASFAVTPFLSANNKNIIMRGELGSLVNTPVYRGFPEDNPQYIEFISVTLSWPATKSVGLSNMFRAQARAMYFDIIPMSGLRLGPPVSNSNFALFA